ncbi:hypothetical protein PAXRUDRAFT_675905 [Paxillus rubicundulus Ve08.2h10]|uniref:Uncharacterized protein n=1 Tax=Paxillus rubicundulus Ve08.2h10 TaxID=930991 RepID=A0A0D0E1P7_9AGAM|nr:hypothetical protein PAXRUDRAFT_675905 [Paxillus rubicundulus Ve08.2h10]
MESLFYAASTGIDESRKKKKDIFDLATVKRDSLFTLIPTMARTGGSHGREWEYRLSMSLGCNDLSVLNRFRTWSLSCCRPKRMHSGDMNQWGVWPR